MSSNSQHLDQPRNCWRDIFPGCFSFCPRSKNLFTIFWLSTCGSVQYKISPVLLSILKKYPRDSRVSKRNWDENWRENVEIVWMRSVLEKMRGWSGCLSLWRVASRSLFRPFCLNFTGGNSLICVCKNVQSWSISLEFVTRQSIQTNPNTWICPLKAFFHSFTCFSKRRSLTSLFEKRAICSSNLSSSQWLKTRNTFGCSANSFKHSNLKKYSTDSLYPVSRGLETIKKMFLEYWRVKCHWWW